MRLRWAGTVAIASMTLIGCGLLLGVDDVGYAPLDPTTQDGAPLDGTASDGADDGPTGADAASAVFNALDDPKFWSFADVPAPDGSPAIYSGAVFDGKYLYLIPQVYGVAVRYDTTSTFGPSGGWATFDIGTISDGGGAPPYFGGGAFDGRYVYFTPSLNGQSGVARYDTQSTAGFASAASWQVFYMERLDPDCKGYLGAAFKDPYVYFVPSYGVTAQYHGHVVRYDTRQPFGTVPSWAFTDLQPALGTTARGYAGAVVAGNELFLVPGSIFPATNEVARLQTSGPFAADAGGWSLSDPQAGPFFGGVFDGRHVYLMPCCGDGTPSTLGKYAVRHDTKPITDAGEVWSLFNTTSLPIAQPSTAGGAFDGRRVFFVPAYVPPGGRNSASGVVTSYDTAAPFASKTSWTQLDLVALEARAKQFQGAAFDGRYVYLLPSGVGPIARFDARSPQAPFDMSFASFF